MSIEIQSTTRATRTGSTVGLAATLLIGFGLFAASQASAMTTHLYAEILTSEQTFLSPQDIAVRFDLAYPGGAPVALLIDVAPGEGLGDGYVDEASSGKQYTHRFRPEAPVDSIVQASLTISVMDDRFGDGPESLAITIDGNDFASGQATFGFYGDSIAAELFEGDGRYDVVVTSTVGDFTLMSSIFTVIYMSEDGLTPALTDTVPGANAVPEPVGFTLFSVGTIVMVAAHRRRSANRR